MPLEPSAFDPAQYLTTPEAAAAYLTDALATNDPALIADAIHICARARGLNPDVPQYIRKVTETL
jgi:probable addiction module antidote protein